MFDSGKWKLTGAQMHEKHVVKLSSSFLVFFHTNKVWVGGESKRSQIRSTKLRALSQIGTKHMRMKAWSDHALHYQ
jgi:hypothetical protein